MTVQEAWNRGNNLLASSIVALAGFAFMPEIFIEDKIQYKADDLLLLLLGLAAIVWYKIGNNRYTRSVAPIILVGLALMVKIAGIIVEIKEKDDVGDDFGGLILFVLATVLVIYLFTRKKPQE